MKTFGFYEVPKYKTVYIDEIKYLFLNILPSAEAKTYGLDNSYDYLILIDF